MKKLIIGMFACLAIILSSCGDSPAKRVDKMKAMYDEMYELAEKDGVGNDAVLDKYQEIQDFVQSEMTKDFPDWTPEERDYFAKTNLECMSNPLCNQIYQAWDARKNGDPNYGKRPEDSALDKAKDKAESAAEDVAGAASDAANAATDAATDAADAAKGAASDAADKVKEAAGKL